LDVPTLYVGQGSLSAVRSRGEAVIVDAHIPDCHAVPRSSIERSLTAAHGAHQRRDGESVRPPGSTGPSENTLPSPLRLVHEWTSGWRLLVYAACRDWVRDAGPRPQLMERIRMVTSS
jgi:hypothetical protein